MSAPAATPFDPPSPERPNVKDLGTAVAGDDIELASSVSFDSLPPLDKGRQAWLTVGAAFILGITVWGEILHCQDRMQNMLTLLTRLPLQLRRVPRILPAPT